MCEWLDGILILIGWDGIPWGCRAQMCACSPDWIWWWWVYYLADNIDVSLQVQLLFGDPPKR